MSIWNFDFSTAPRDGSQILVSTSTEADKKKLFITKWLEPTKYTPNGRFDGFSENSNSLLAWCELPLHPHHMPPADLSPVAAEAVPFIDDVGGF